MIRTKRTKSRPGRLKGAALAELRRQCFERDEYRCQHVIFSFQKEFTIYEMMGIREELRGTELRCRRQVTWEGSEAGHMHHIRNKRMWGDTLENVTTLCAKCHAKIHNFGPSMTKPVPAKEKP